MWPPNPRVLEVYDSYRNRPLARQRCVAGQASTGGPPMLPGPYNNNYQVVQTPGYVMILVEQIHDVRIIRLDGRPHLPANIRQWMGTQWAIGKAIRWKSADTTNLTDKEKLGFGGPLEKPARDRALHPRPCEHNFSTDSQSTIPSNFCEAMDRRVSFPGSGWPDLRVRMPRGELRNGRHSQGSSPAREGSSEPGKVDFKAMPRQLGALSAGKWGERKI